ncbi:MAG: hypothetical protein ABFD92_13440 [Planctomycetaceae bacterium]|nr:hypothetical protein [Planctomycetaceae bacterium]
MALSVAMLAVLWHLLACVESPMAFSPDGKTLALTVMDSSHGKLGSGDAVFRLMVISGREKLVVLEETSEKMLSAPTYTPDGKSLAYVRIPLPTKEQIDAIVQASKEGDEARDAQVAKLMALLQPKQKAASSPVTREAATAATAASASSAKLARQELPPINSMIDLVRNYYAGPEWPCEIVLRDAQSFEIRKVIPFRMHALSYTNKPLEGMATAYIFTQPQFSPNGGKIYIASGAEVVAVDLPGGETTLVAAPATLSILSPDGKTLAAVGEKYIAISHLDGDLTVWKHIPDAEALWSIAWMDNKTLGVVRKSGTGYALIGIGRDGRETVQIALPEDEKEIYSVARAKAGNMALTAGGKISLLDAKGKTVAKIPEITGQRGKLIVSNPTWSDDSKTLAVKLVEKGDKEEATVAVAFFDAAGKPIGRVAIPQAKRPASQPADVQPGRKGAAGSGKHLPGASAPSTSQADE